MNDKFIRMEDMYQNPIVVRESDIKKLIQSKDYATITFTDGSKFQVKTHVDNIWAQLSQNSK